jgi:hypothetical protein
MKNPYEVLVRKPGCKRPLRRPKSTSEDGIRIDLRETEWDVVDWIHLAHDRDQWRALVDMIMNLQVP